MRCAFFYRLFEYSRSQGGHKGVIHHRVYFALAHILKHSSETEEIGCTHQGVCNGGGIYGVHLREVALQRSGVASCEGNVVICEHALIDRKAAPDDVINVGVLNGVLYEALDTLALALISGFAISDCICKIILDLSLVFFHQIAVDIRLCIEIYVECTNGGVCLFTDI